MKNEYYEQPLSGGRMTEGVVRIGDTVRRPIGPRSEFTHALLKLLEEKKFGCAPRFLGIDEKEREILTFLEGEVPHREMNWTDSQLITIIHMLKDFHNATAGSKLAGGKEVICHNDIAPWNTVLDHNAPTAFIDFDDAAPGNRIDDVAYFLWTFLKLGSDVPADVQAEKIRMLCDAYGLTERHKLIDAILEQQEKILAKRELLAKNAKDHEAREFSLSRIEHIRSESEWIKAHRGALEVVL